jgi:hypothetical protein
MHGSPSHRPFFGMPPFLRLTVMLVARKLLLLRLVVDPGHGSAPVVAPTQNQAYEARARIVGKDRSVLDAHP